MSPVLKPRGHQGGSHIFRQRGTLHYASGLAKKLDRGWPVHCGKRPHCGDEARGEGFEKQDRALGLVGALDGLPLLLGAGAQIAQPATRRL